MKKYYYNELTAEELSALCDRAALQTSEAFSVAEQVIEQVKDNGDKALSELSKKFDGVEIVDFAVSSSEIEKSNF